MESYTRVVPVCSSCQEDLSQHRADDAPPYFTIMAVGHLIIPLILLAEIKWAWPVWLHLVIWLPVIIAFTFWLLPRVKGAIVGLQWANRMHGFGGQHERPYEP